MEHGAHSRAEPGAAGGAARVAPHEVGAQGDDAPTALSAARRDLALDLVAVIYPCDAAIPLRARDAAAARDPALRLVAARHFPRLLSLFAARGDAATVRELLASGRVDPTVKTNEALRTAAAMGWVDVVDALLADARVGGAALRASLTAATHAASRNDHAVVFARLLD
jgi:hypothetical protein